MEVDKNIEIKKLTRENVRMLKPYSSARDEYVSDGRSMVFLDANESPFESGLNRYPDPQQRRLKQLLARQKGLRPANILLGNGSDEVLDLIFRAFCEPGADNIITLPPTYGMYKVLASVNAVENREVLLDENFQPDVDRILRKADGNSKVLFLCSPNNPTANSFARDKVESLLSAFRGLVVIDEAYIDFSRQPGWLGEIDSWPRLIVTQTLSKAYGMAGIRLGICYASAAIIEVLNKIKPPYNINELTQRQAYQSINEAQAVAGNVDTIRKERDKLAEQLGQIACIRHIFPSDANFILARMDDADLRYRQLLEKGIVVRNRSGQPLCENTLRFTVGNPEENLKLAEALKSL